MSIYKCLFTSLLLASLFCQPVHADEPLAQKYPGWKSVLKKLQACIDSASVKGVDQRYVEIPKKPWQIAVRGNINQSELKMKSFINSNAYAENAHGTLEWEPRIRTDITTYTGVWVGYRGYGIGMAKNIGGDKGSLMTLGAVSGKYSLNLRIHHFETDDPVVNFTGQIENDETGEVDMFDDTQHFMLYQPLKVKTVMFDGIYFFNSRKFSNLAAYDQSTIQRRSAGSPIAGCMIYYSKVNYDTPLNNDLIFFMNNIGRIKQWQASVGAGYAYNWVIGKNLMLNATVMPMLSFYNRLKVYTYDSYLLQEVLYGDDNDEIDDPDNWWIKPSGTKKVNGKVKLNYDARMSLTYNLKDWFFNVNGQFCNFRYKHASSKGRLNDWYVNASVGIRL